MSQLKEKLNQTHIFFKNSQFPTMPKEVMQLRREFSESATPDLNDLTEIISKNLSLSAEVIMMANTPFCLGSRLSKVTTIHEAVALIGMTKLKNLVMSASFKTQMNSMAVAEITDFSVAAASVCAEISHHVDNITVDEAYTAGLFHKSGALLASQKFDNYDKQFLENLKYAYSAPRLEEEKYGTSTAMAGVLVAQKWELDRLLLKTILMKHQRNLANIIDDKGRNLVAIVQMAYAIVIQRQYANYSGEEVELMLENSMDELMLEEQIIEECGSVLEDSFLNA